MCPLDINGTPSIARGHGVKVGGWIYQDDARIIVRHQGLPRDSRNHHHRCCSLVCNRNIDRPAHTVAGGLSLRIARRLRCRCHGEQRSCYLHHLPEHNRLHHDHDVEHPHCSHLWHIRPCAGRDNMHKSLPTLEKHQRWHLPTLRNSQLGKTLLKV